MSEPIWKSWLGGLIRRFDESKHPRKPRGARGGGQFAPKGGVVVFHSTKMENAPRIESGGLVPGGANNGFNADAGLPSDREFIYVNKFPPSKQVLEAGNAHFAVAVPNEKLERDYDQVLAGWKDYAPAQRANALAKLFPSAKWKPYAQWDESDVKRAIDGLTDSQYEKLFHGNYRVRGYIGASRINRLK